MFRSVNSYFIFSVEGWRAFRWSPPAQLWWLPDWPQRGVRKLSVSLVTLASINLALFCIFSVASSWRNNTSIRALLLANSWWSSLFVLTTFAISWVWILCVRPPNRPRKTMAALIRLPGIVRDFVGPIKCHVDCCSNLSGFDLKTFKIPKLLQKGCHVTQPLPLDPPTKQINGDS